MFKKVKSRLVLHFWYRLTWVVPDKGSLNGCVCVCVCDVFTFSSSSQSHMRAERTCASSSRPSTVHSAADVFSFCLYASTFVRTSGG